MGKELMLSGMNHVVRRFVGSSWSDELSVGLLNKTDPALSVTGPESFPFFAFCLVLRGNGSYVDWESGRRFPLKANTYFLRIPGIVHQIRIDPASRWRECFLNLGYNAYPYFRAYHGILPENPVGKFVPDDAWIDAYFKLENELEFSPVGSLLELLPAFFHLVSRAVQQTEYDDSTRQRIKYACEFLCSDFREKKDIREFCRTHGWGYENFRKKFAEIMGMPPNQYRMKRRHETACALLMQRTLTIADIARELGYCSPQEFAAKFRRRTGKSPSEYRENLPANYF